MKLNIYPGNPESLPVRFVWGSNPLAYFVDAAAIREVANPATSISSFLADTNQYLLSAQAKLGAALTLPYAGVGVANTNDVLVAISSAQSSIATAMGRDSATLVGASAIKSDVESAVGYVAVAMSFIQGSYTIFDMFEDEGAITHSDELLYREALFCAELCSEEVNECLLLAETLVLILSGGSAVMWKRSVPLEYLDLSKKNFSILLPYETKVKRERIINASFSRKHPVIYGQHFASFLPDYRRAPSAGSERLYSEFSGYSRLDDTAQVIRYFPEISNGKIVVVVPQRNTETVAKMTAGLWRVSYVWISNIKKKKTSQPFTTYSSGALPPIPAEDDYGIAVTTREVSANAGAPFNQNGTVTQNEPFNSAIIDDNQRVITSTLSAQTISVNSGGSFPVYFYWSGHTEAKVTCFNEDGSSSVLLSLNISPPTITGALGDLTLSVFSDTVSFITATKNGVVYAGHSRSSYTGLRSNMTGTISLVSRAGIVGILGTDGLDVETDVTSQIADGRSLDVVGAYAEAPSRYCVVYVVGSTFGGLKPQLRCFSNHGLTLLETVKEGGTYMISSEAFHYNTSGVLALVCSSREPEMEPAVGIWNYLVIGGVKVASYPSWALGPSVPPPCWLRWSPDDRYVVVGGRGGVRLFTSAGLAVSGPVIGSLLKVVKVVSKPLKTPSVTPESTVRTYEFLVLSLGRLVDTETSMNSPQLATLRVVVTEPISGPASQTMSFVDYKYPDGGSSLGPYLGDIPREVFMCDSI